MKKLFTLVALVAVVGLAASAQANDPREYFGEGGPLVDSVGGAPGDFRTEIFVTDNGVIKNFDSVTLLGFSHTWAGDLVITLTHKDTGSTALLLDRPGVPESTFGDSADFDGGDYTWVKEGGFLYDADIFGVTVTEHVLAPLSGFDAFVGEDKFGVWSLHIVDHAGGDSGALQGWSMLIFNVPGPGSLALLGLAGLIAGRRRRR